MAGGVHSVAHCSCQGSSPMEGTHSVSDLGPEAWEPVWGQGLGAASHLGADPGWSVEGGV